MFLELHKQHKQQCKKNANLIVLWWFKWICCLLVKIIMNNICIWGFGTPQLTHVSTLVFVCKIVADDFFYSHLFFSYNCSHKQKTHEIGKCSTRYQMIKRRWVAKTTKMRKKIWCKLFKFIFFGQIFFFTCHFSYFFMEFFSPSLWCFWRLFC